LEIEDKEQTHQFRNELTHLRHLLLKQLASLSQKQKYDYANGLNYYIEAAELDSSDVCLWYEMAQCAFELGNFIIAKLAFEQSLQINPSYWPSLDALIVLLYAIGNYDCN
jgi:tetratricopeptide (TPR) repeat protein